MVPYAKIQHFDKYIVSFTRTNTHEIKSFAFMYKIQPKTSQT